MAVDYEIEVPVQSSIYKKNFDSDDSRLLTVKFSIPEKGINEDTGMVLLIDGFGAGSETNVYKKIKCTFAASAR